MSSSMFLNTRKSWDDDEFKISAELKKGIKDRLNWENPSRIQALTIPYIVNPNGIAGCISH